MAFKMMTIHLMTMVKMLVPHEACSRPLKGFNKDILGVKDDDHIKVKIMIII